MQITKEDYLKIKDFTLTIDVRSKQEFNSLKKIPGAINVYYLDLLSNPDKYIKNKSDLIVVYCNAGNRSGETAFELSRKGYNVKVLIGGVYKY